MMDSMVEVSKLIKCVFPIHPRTESNLSKFDLYDRYKNIDSLKIIEPPARDYQEVLAGRADVHITSNIEAATLVEQYQQLAIVPVKEVRYTTPLAWLTPQDDQVWINYLNHWIEIKKAQGFFDVLMDKYSLKSL